MLLHRTNCKNQFIDELIRDNKTDVIDIMTYQKLERIDLNNKEYDFSKYQYIVCDEFHYFMSDAAFNITTDLSLRMILKQVFPIKIFMSATGSYMKTYINDHTGIITINYELPISYDFVKRLIFFNKDETLELFIEEAIKKKDKGIFFIQSAQKAYDLYNKYKENCLFNCSENNKQYYKYVDKTKINQMLKKEHFDELILITTTCMDAGVNIKDLELKHIVCDVKDTGTLIQCIGRKRIQNKNDKFNLYIKAMSNKALGSKKGNLKKKISMADYYKTHTLKEYILKYKRQYDTTQMVYDEAIDEDDKGTKKINDLMYFKCQVDLKEVDQILELGKDGYCNYFSKIFQKEYRNIEENFKTDRLVRYLKKIKGKNLYKKEQEQLYITANIKRDGKLLKSYGSLNAYFIEVNIPYKIESFTDNKRKLNDNSNNSYFKKVYWIVSKYVCPEN